MMKTMKSRPTQKQIADKLGLSAATVSLALRDNPVVAKSTRDLVQQAMRETGYVRNLAAASLRTGRSNIVGVSFHTVAHSYYGELLVSIERAFADTGTVILVNNHEEDIDKLDRFISTLATYGADALLVAPPPGTPLSVMERVGQHGMPVLYMGRHVEGDESADLVGMDERMAGEMAARHLIEAGYDRLCMVGGQEGNSISLARVAGFRAALEAAGLEWSEDCWIPSSTRRLEAVEALKSALARDPAPHGIVCSGNSVASVTCGLVKEAGLQPGRDVGLVGIGSERIAEATSPRMTMVCEDIDTLGQLGAETILGRLQDPEKKTSRIVLDPRLVVGETSRR